MKIPLRWGRQISFCKHYQMNLLTPSFQFKVDSIAVPLFTNSISRGALSNSKSTFGTQSCCSYSIFIFISSDTVPIDHPHHMIAECDVPVPGIPGTGNFLFFWWYRNRYREKLVPEKSLGTGIGQIWYR